MLDKLACLVGNGGERKGYACFLVSYAELLWLLVKDAAADFCCC